MWLRPPPVSPRNSSVWLGPREEFVLSPRATGLGQTSARLGSRCRSRVRPDSMTASNREAPGPRRGGPHSQSHLSQKLIPRKSSPGGLQLKVRFQFRKTLKPRFLPPPVAVSKQKPPAAPAPRPGLHAPPPPFFPEAPPPAPSGSGTPQTSRHPGSPCGSSFSEPTPGSCPTVQVLT